jgi:hypothetical protein
MYSQPLSILKHALGFMEPTRSKSLLVAKFYKAESSEKLTRIVEELTFYDPSTAGELSGCLHQKTDWNLSHNWGNRIF